MATTADDSRQSAETRRPVAEKRAVVASRRTGGLHGPDHVADRREKTADHSQTDAHGTAASFLRLR